MALDKLLIVGLGNPGKDYEKTRHNFGADFVELLASRYQIPLANKDKFFCHYGEKELETCHLYLSVPSVYVNESGRTVLSLKKYLNLSSENILIIHDDLDLPLGTIRLKESGGHGGHNGLRDIIENLKGDNEFKRLRIGIGHPSEEKDVIKYVLSKVSKKEREILENTFDDTLSAINPIFEGDWQKAMLELHSD